MSDQSVGAPDRWTVGDVDDDFEDDGYEAGAEEGDGDGAQ